METVFIVNPCAGKGRDIHSIIESVENLKKSGKNVTGYVTKAVGDATNFVKNYCEKNGAARFIACGGDGTLNEVLNGAIGFDDAEVGVIPFGTGNDFCRNFNIRKDFLDRITQADTGSKKCDAIKYKTVLDGKEKVGYCVNMFNIGFDCTVADTTDTVKEKTIARGPFAYFISIFITLIRKKCQNITIELDGKVRHKGKLLLTSLANGSYCGGGIKSNPLASVNDGFININIIKNMSRIRLMGLLPHYMKGTHLKLKNIGRFITCERCQKVTVTPNQGSIRLCVDGEVIDAGRTEFEIVHNAFNFVVPDKTSKERVFEKVK